MALRGYLETLGSVLVVKSEHFFLTFQGSTESRSCSIDLATESTFLLRILETFCKRNLVTSRTVAYEALSKLEDGEFGVLQLWQGLIGDGPRCNKIPLTKSPQNSWKEGKCSRQVNPTRPTTSGASSVRNYFWRTVGKWQLGTQKYIYRKHLLKSSLRNSKEDL